VRLYVRHIWRAFPELDRFDDDQCWRFVCAARRGRSIPRRLWWLTLKAGCVFPVIAAGSIFFAIIIRWAPSANPADLRTTDVVLALLVANIVLAAAGVMLTWLYAGHWLLRYRIEWVLRARARCGGCGYGLIGLPVGADFRITCPECGLAASVDPALGQLAAAPGGTPVFSPRNDLPKGPT